MVKSEKGDVSAAIVPSTRVLRGHEAVTVRDIHLGERVVVHARETGGHLEASVVMLAPAPK